MKRQKFKYTRSHKSPFQKYWQLFIFIVLGTLFAAVIIPSFNDNSNTPLGTDVSATAHQIAQGHAFSKHVLNKREFRRFNITNRAQFANLLVDVINNPTHSGQLARGRSYAYDAKRNILVIKDPNNSDLGTAFRPNSGLSYVRRLR